MDVLKVSLPSLITRPMIRRSIVTSGVVGTILFTINHELAALFSPWPALFVRQLALSMAIPFVVSLLSAVLTRREMLNTPPESIP